MKTKILQEFLNSDIKIKSKEKLKQYIDYCIDNNQKERLHKEDGYSKSSYHHILPKSLFPLYSKLKENPWNGTHLLYSDHYYAHWLITESIDDYGQLHAFVAMHNKDIKNGRIEEKDLIPKDEFQEKMEEKNKKHSETMMKEFINENGELTSIAKEVAKKHSETMMKEFINENGELTSIAKETGKKISKTRQSTEWKESIGKEASKKHSITKQSTEWKESIGKEAYSKISKTKQSTEWKESIGKEASKNFSETMMKEYTNENGEFTSKAKENAINSAKTMSMVQEDGMTIREKASRKKEKTNLEKYGNTFGNIEKALETRTKEYINENGEITTINKEQAKRYSENYEKNTQYYKIINSLTDEVFIDRINYRDMRKISHALIKKTKEDYLGKNNHSKGSLKRRGKENLIGLYCIKI